MIDQPLIVKKCTAPENETLTLDRYLGLVLQAKFEIANSGLRKYKAVKYLPWIFDVLILWKPTHIAPLVPQQAVHRFVAA